MIKLSTLTGRELAALDAALTALDGALDVVAERGYIDEADGVDLLELAEAVGAEVEQREAQDAA
jgi:hypothetical protein